jgi:hypothetical protein
MMAKKVLGRRRKHIAQQPKATGKKLPAAVILGHLGGLKGGVARDRKLSPRRKKQIASMGQKALQRKRAESGKPTKKK